MVTPDLSYKLRGVQEQREEEGRSKSSLTMSDLSQLRTVLRHYVNFLQKQKVSHVSNLAAFNFNFIVLWTVFFSYFFS